jgi:hypothetical protein
VLSQRLHGRRIPLKLITSYNENELSKFPGFVSKPVSVPLLSSSQIGSSDLLLVEKNSELDVEIAKSLAVAMGARVALIPACSNEEYEEAKELLRVWGSGSNAALEQDEALNRLRGIVKDRLGELLTFRAKTMTFFTKGIPYGAFVLDCPTSHFFAAGSATGLCVLRSLIKTSSARNIRVPLAVVCDPDNTGGSEFDDLGRILHSAGYVQRHAYGKGATSFEVKHLAEYMPCDMFILSTHAGERPGERVKERFVTSDGRTHTIVYDRVLSFAGTMEPDMVEVGTFLRFISLDGVKWDDDEGKKAAKVGEILREYTQIVRGDAYKADQELIGSTKVTVRASDSLGMHDGGVLNPMFFDCGGHTYPLVFVNACSSWLEIAKRFSLAGASTYIGTARDVPNFLASDFAVRFMSFVARGRAIGPAVFNAQKEYTATLGYNYYLMHGFMYAAFKPTGNRYENKGKVLMHISDAVDGWISSANLHSDPKVRSAAHSIARFLKREMSLLLTK